MKKIGFIGVGIMGKSMVRNLMKAGYELHIYARTKAKVEDVISEGAIFHETIGECVKGCEAVITIHMFSPRFSYSSLLRVFPSSTIKLLIFGSTSHG